VSWTAPFTYTTGQVLTAANLNTYLRDNTDFLGGAARPHARVFNSANQSLTTAVTLAPVLYDSERVDVGAIHSTVTNTGRLTVPTGAGGWWMVGLNAAIATNTTGSRQCAIRVNGTTTIAIASAPGANVDNVFAMVTAYQVAAGDYFDSTAFQNSGGALNLQVNGNYSCEFWCQWECV
jgi:hypothetical protein